MGAQSTVQGGRQEAHLLEQQALHSILHSEFLQADPLFATCTSILGQHPGVFLPGAQQVDCEWKLWRLGLLCILASLCLQEWHQPAYGCIDRLCNGVYNTKGADSLNLKRPFHATINE